jgi:hypothetical protein
MEECSFSAVAVTFFGKRSVFSFTHIYPAPLDVAIGPRRPGGIVGILLPG